jgi:hypothetical protein
MQITTCRPTREERVRPMRCDLLVPDEILSRTHGIDLAVPPDRAWPWLAQMGAGRGGWYSWDRLDNGGHRSADRVVPQLQRGDLLPAVPGALDAFIVEYVEPPRDLVLRWPAGGDGSRASWEILLVPALGGSRLVVRARLGALALQTERSEAGQHASFVVRLHGALLRLPVTILRPIGALGHRVMQARRVTGRPGTSCRPKARCP